LEREKHINGAKGGNEVFFECGDGMLGSICLMVMQGDKLDVNSLSAMDGCDRPLLN
jgi:hypothetical protein